MVGKTYIEDKVMNSFAPTIKLDGETITPKGYEWVLGFALAGCEWAIKEATDPVFILKVRDQLNKENILKLNILIKRHEEIVKELKKDLDSIS